MKQLNWWALSAFFLIACQPQVSPALPKSPPEYLVATNVRIEILVEEREMAAENIINCAQQMGGYMAGNNNDSESRGETILDLRLPSRSYPQALEECMSEYGEVASVYVWSQDITAQYAALHDELMQLETRVACEPYSRTWSIKRKIESLSRKMAYRLERAAYATVIVHITSRPYE